MFAKLPRRETAVDACAGSIRAAILRGEILAGSRLPAERKLAESFGVNRVTVRSALTQLAARGLLTVRQGSGYLVQDFRRVGGLDLVPDLVASTNDPVGRADMIRDLLLVRRQLATIVLDRLTQPSPDQIEAIARAIDGFALAATLGDDLEMAAADLEVLAAILEATSSRVLQLFFNPVLSVVMQLPELRAAMYAEPESNLVAYRALLAWFAQPPVDRRDPLPMLAILAQRDEQTLALMEVKRHEVSDPHNET